MNNQKLNEKITIIIVMYEESFDLICKTLEKITNFKKIIIDNAGDANMKNNIISKFGIEKYILNKKNSLVLLAYLKKKTLKAVLFIFQYRNH